MKEITFKFLDYKLVKLNFSANLEIESGTDQVIEPSFKMEHNVIAPCQVSASLEVQIKEPKLPFSIQVEIAGLFELSCSDISTERLDRLVTVNLNGVLFPFLREIVADCTRRAGFSPLLLPSVNFVKVYQERLIRENADQ